VELVSGVLLLPLVEPVPDVELLLEPLWSELLLLLWSVLLCFLCFFFLPVLVSVELFWSLPVPLVPLAVEPVPLVPVPDCPLISELDDPLEPVPLVEPDAEPLPD
jgi:hypothetical protein